MSGKAFADPMDAKTEKVVRAMASKDTIFAFLPVVGLQVTSYWSLLVNEGWPCWACQFCSESGERHACRSCENAPNLEPGQTTCKRFGPLCHHPLVSTGPGAGQAVAKSNNARDEVVFSCPNKALMAVKIAIRLKAVNGQLLETVCAVYSSVALTCTVHTHCTVVHFAIRPTKTTEVVS